MEMNSNSIHYKMSHSEKTCTLILTQCIVRPICTPFVDCASHFEIETDDDKDDVKMETNDDCLNHKETERKPNRSSGDVVARIFSQEALFALIGNQPVPKPMSWQAGGRSTYSKYYRARGSVCWYVCRLIQHVCLPHLCSNCRPIIAYAGRPAFENYADFRHGN